MQYTTLGKTDVKISRICLGTMTWGFQNNESEGHQQMDLALDKGVNFWDTAEMYAVPPTAETYGSTETIIGTWLSKNGKRDEIVLASKIAPQMPYIRGGGDLDRANINQAIDDSLTRLQTDYIDLYQLHWPSNRSLFHFNNIWSYEPKNLDRKKLLDNQLEILETLEGHIKAGKIRHWGLSNDSAWGITQYANLAAQNGLTPPASIQNEYSLLRRRDDINIAEACVIEGISYLPWSPLGMGILSGKYLAGGEPEGARLTFNEAAKDRYGYRLTGNVEKATACYMEIARANDLDPCQMAIAFCLSRSFVASPIIGATSLEQLTTNIDAINVTLSDDVLSAIDGVHHTYPMPF